MISSLPTIASAAEQIRAGELTPLDLVEFCLARIDQFESRIQAWVLVDREGARREAERQGALFAAGIDPGPLAGIPIAIKDIIDVAGFPTKAGSRLRQGHMAQQDAPLVARLRAAGAIILGKTVTTEFASFDPPPTRNPWHLGHTPGGSSSGSAAAVALEMCLAAIGSQTGGSIIRPASYCGVAGFKPTFGHVPLDGVVPLSPHLDHAGPLARHVQDLAMIYGVLSESSDSQAVGQGSRLSHDPAFPNRDTKQLDATAGPPQLRSLESYFLQQASSAVQTVTREALAKLLEPSPSVASWELPASFRDVHDRHLRIMAVDAAEVHRQAYRQSPEAFGPNIAKLIEAGLSTSQSDYEAALEHQREFRREIAAMFTSGVIALMPATPTTAPASRETTGDPKFNSPWSHAGVPVVTIPCGLAEDGMPCGLQMVGAPDSDLQLLQAAAWCEERLAFHERPQLRED